MIESNLNALCISPRIHREELRRYVHLPRLIRIEYDAQTAPEISSALELVQRAQKAAEIKKLLRKADHIYSELGLWAAERYISIISTRLSEPIDREQDAKLGWRDVKTVIRSILHCFQASQLTQSRRTQDRFEISPKVKALIDFIVSQQKSKMSGIVFVDQRATAAMLQMLLSAHPDTKDLSYATFVGTSNPSSRRSQLSEIIDLNDQRNTLEDFRTRKCNVIIATSVLEEGIDISSCNLVVCYNKPANLKSFIQRRGRARERKSIFVLMLAQGDSLARSKNWEALEADMIQMYQDQRRKLDHELHMEELVDHGDRRFKVDSTG